MFAADFVSRLDGVKSRGPDKWMARCPAHDDKDPSLSIATSPEGNILLHCWTGCSAADVVSAMGLSLSDLFARELDYARPMAFAQRERRQQEDRQQHIDRERLIIALAESDRRAGKRQSPEDRQRELEAVRYLINANVEYEPDIVLMAVAEEFSGTN